MKEDFSVPKEFEAYSANLFKKDKISNTEFIEFCLLATQLIYTHWNRRQGMAYHITGAWMKYQNISENDLLDQIGSEFAGLELPDHLVASNEEGVRKKWSEVAELLKQANSENHMHSN